MFVNMRRGSAVVDVVLAAAIIVFVILPVFSAIVERFILFNKVQIIKDAADMTNVSVYNAINAGNLGKDTVNLDFPEAEYIFRILLAANLKLDIGLSPLPQSLAEGNVLIDSLEIYSGGFPRTCPDGTIINRPTVHSLISVPVKPTLYRQLILNALGKDYLELKVHVDSEIPVNN
jgi:hypothetical protein